MNPAYPPGPPASRQELLAFAASPLAYFLKLAATYGDFAYVRLATRDTYVVSTPDLFRAILVEQDEHFEKTDHTRDSASTFLGEGLLVSAGEVHRRHRRLLQPLFTPAQVEPHAAVMVQATDALLRTWQAGQTRDIPTDMLRLTLHIVGETIFGITTGHLLEAVARASGIVQRYTDETMRRSKRTTVSDGERAEAVHLLDEVIAGVLARPAAGGQDLVTRMRAAVDAETGQGLSAQEVRDEALTLLMAGHETTANALV